MSARLGLASIFCIFLAVGVGAAEEAKSLARHKPTSEELKSSFAAAAKLGALRANKVLNEQLRPMWLSGGRMWYARQTPAGTEFVLVDLAAGTKKPAFDHEKLAAGLAKAAKQTVDPKKLPFAHFNLPEDGQNVIFAAFGKTWRCPLDTYEPIETEAKNLIQPPTPAPATRGRRADAPAPRNRPQEATTKAGQTLFIKDHNLFFKATQDCEPQALTTEGNATAGFILVSASPDGQAFAAQFRRQVPTRQLDWVEFFPKAGFLAKLEKRSYDQPGDKMSTTENWIVPLDGLKPRRVEFEPSDFGLAAPRWRKEGHRFLFEQTDRGHQRFRLAEVDACTGAVRLVIDEKTSTFIALANQYTNYIGDEAVLYASERSGWNHLHWVELDTGAIKPITQGEWRVRRVEATNDDQKLIWFTASGMDEGKDPYYLHYFKVNYDGTGLTRLTEGHGTHALQFDPSWAYAVDTWSRVDQPPVHELRRTADGKLVCKLEEADATKLKEAGWKPPEVFVAKGRDGKTDIWGLVFWPPQLDSTKRYPVIEHIYAGPQDSFVPKRFASYHHEMERLAAVGFIVVKIDGMGTANRSKAFHDVCWKNLADAGLPDRILWMKALAAKHPEMDLERVGITGGSAGGQNSTGALLFQPDFYKVAVSNCGCHDNRIDKRWWNEQWMGYPVGPHYAAQSNIENAAKLRGRLLLTVGEKDTNVPPESTYRLADALMKARKEFELLVLPGAGHGDGGPYGERKRRDFFIRHLMDVEPPNPNGGE